MIYMVVEELLKKLEKISLVYPSEYQLKEFDGEFIPCWFDESELEFVDKDDERNYKLNKILNG